MPHQATKLQMSAALLHVRGCLSMQRGFSSKELLKAFRGTEQLVQKVGCAGAGKIRWHVSLALKWMPNAAQPHLWSLTLSQPESRKARAVWGILRTGRLATLLGGFRRGFVGP